MTIGNRIKIIRTERGLTQKQLGKLCGMADSAIRRYENGRSNPTEKTLKRIADALGVSVRDLLSTTGHGFVFDINASTDKLYQSFLASEGKKISGSYVSDQQRLLSAFHRLNDKGQQEAVRSVEIIAGNPIYQRTPSTEATETPLQAFADDGQGKYSTTQEKPSEG